MSALPNPDTYLNHFPPAQAAQFEAARNLSLAVLGNSAPERFPSGIGVLRDVKASTTVRRTNTLVLTNAFRLFALTFTALAVIEFTHPVDHCNAINYCIGVGCVLTISSTTFIFLQRLRAVYSGNKRVQIIAILLWIGVVITMAFTVVDARSAHVPGTNYCAYMVVDRSLLANGVVFVAFDTFAFLAISYKIGYTHLDLEDGAGFVAAVSGRALPRLSQAVIRGGQQYYLITLCLQIPVLVLTAIPSVSPNLKLMLTFPLGCLAASMACRIFRNMKMDDNQLRFPATVSDVNFVPSSRLQVSGISSSARPPTVSVPHPAAIRFPPKASTSSGPSSPDKEMQHDVKH
ncbi:hypothetical protein NP233_g6582 [Leucocoprinus birnbaumii]|uniref:Uncharacterized protein n=1 Tax=Leucocoprinus birnbaumii TaxID=56174 RepID=A0AAD5VQX0_9AGAR|nr:hypothetical protein NP233_g6582 [Leucocoprinus birnbaumii]